MSVSSNVKYEFTSIKQIETLKDYNYKLTGNGQEDIQIQDLMRINSKDLTLEYNDCFCRDDFEWIIPDLSVFIAKNARECSFVCHDAYFTNDVDGTTIEFDIEYNEGILRIGERETGSSYDLEGAEDCSELSFVITGKLNKYKNRDDITEFIEDMGGIVKDSVSKNIDYVICNDSHSNTRKIKKALELNIPILSEIEFITRFSNPYAFEGEESIKPPYDYREIEIKDELQYCEPLSNLSEKELKAIWNTKKTDEGSLIITGYKGDKENLVIPEYIGKHKVTAIGERAFSPKTKSWKPKSGDREQYYKNVLKSVVIPESVVRIEKSAFSGCSELQNVVIKGTIDRISESTFSECEKLHNINIPEGLICIDYQAFSGCKRLTNIVFPETLKTIGFQAFWGCGLELLDISENITDIGKGAFIGCKNLKDVTIPKSITIINESTFSGCENLEVVRISDSVATIERNAFQGCFAIKEIQLPKTMKVISIQLFSQCKCLKKITIPDGVTTIEQSAFESCENLAEIELPNSIKIIRAKAFAYCRKLKKIKLPEGLEEISKSSIIGCDGLGDSIQVPAKARIVE